VDDLLDRALTVYRQIHIIKDVATLVRRSAGNGTPRDEHASRYEVGAMHAEAEAATDPMDHPHLQPSDRDLLQVS
jgi:hypothetical protein